MTKTTYLLTGDIGGTNSRMSLYATCDSCDRDDPLVVELYRNAQHLPENCRGDDTCFQKHIVIPFLELCWKRADLVDDCHIVACFAIAGVVTNNRVSVTNLGGLVIDGNVIAEDRSHKHLKKIIQCRIINDFVAQGYGCLTLKSNEVRQLYGPRDVKVEDLHTGVKVCVGAGTGLGECFLTQDTTCGRYTCFPSEGGHVEFAPRNDLELNLWRYLSDKYSSKHRISVERVVSGKGLANVYEFLAHQFPARVISSVHEEFLQANDEQGKVVAVNAKEGTLCYDAMKIMMAAYGCEVGSAAIKWIPTGGLFVTGGITPKNIHFMEGQNSDFMLAFRNKGRVATLLEGIPMYAVMVEDLGIRGVHKAALTEYEEFYRQRKIVKDNKIGRWVQENIWITLAASSFVSFAAGLVWNRSSRR